MTLQWKSLARSAAILVAGVTLGLLLSAGQQSPFSTGGTGPEAPMTRWSAGTVDTAESATSKVWTSIEHLEAEQQQLKVTLAELRRDLAERQQLFAAQTDRLQALEAEADRQRMLAGLIPMQGPGIQVILDDSGNPMHPGTNANSYIIHAYDLRDIVNVLWMAGSEAIAINGERLVSTSSIYCAGSTVMVNNTRLSPPYLIRAIGDSLLQQDYLRNPGYLLTLRDKQRLYGVQFDVEALGNVTVPAHTGGFLLQDARPGE
jgi:uncharacterized protein YlxW (UPF0749 family)